MSRNRRGIALVSRWVLVCMLALFPIASHALALGKLKVLSALNEPLNAEIDFTSVTDKELKGLAVTLASRADFDAAGVDRPSFLSQIKFMVSRRLDGHYFLQLRTDDQINEPFLHLLLQVDWPGGRLVREYTALIDPPYQIASKPAPVETPVVTPPAPEAVVEPAPTPAPEAAKAEAPKEETPPAVTAPTEEAKAPEQPKAAEEAPSKEEVPKQAEAAPAETASTQPEPLGPPDVSVAAAPGAVAEESAAPKVEPLAATPKAEVPPPPAPEATTTAPAWATMSEYDVKKGDTMWRIAEKARGSNQELTTEQVILAIYRSNKNAFFGNNVNNLKAGKILRMPEREDVESVAGPQAWHEFRAQYDAWQEYKLKLAAAAGAIKVTEAPETAPSAAEAKPVEKPAEVVAPKKAETKPSTAAAPSATDKGRQDELLKIVRSTLEQQKTTPEKGVAEKESAKESGAQERQALADRAAALEESIESKRMENKDLSEKVGIVRSQLKKESRLIALENEGLAQQTQRAPEAKPAETPAKPVEKPAAIPPQQKAQAETTPAPVPEKPKPTPIAPKKRAVPPPAPKEEKGFLATVLEAVQSDLVMPVVIGIVVLLSGGIALVYFRRRQKSIAEFEESILSADAISTEQPATTGTVASQQPAVTTGGDTSFLSDFSQGGMGNIHTDEVDPIAEAEVYLAYGRDETAEEILKDAVVKNPDRQELKLKLLEIYHQRNDVAAFETLAEELYAALGGRGGKIWEKVEEMGRKLNPENPMFRGGAPVKASSPAAKPAILSAAKPAAAAAAAAIGKAATAVGSAKTEMVSGLDFDMEAPTAAGEKAPATGFDLDFGAPKAATADTEDFTAATPAGDKGGSDFESLDLGAPADNALDFELGQSGAGGHGGTEAPAGTENEIKWEPTPAAAPSAAAEAEVDLAAAAPAGEAPVSGQWDETATKLDLAKAYIDMGDAEGARSILQEVMAEGNDAQKKQAQALSTQIA